MKKTSKKRNWQKRCLEAVPKTRSDNRGYTLQTVIVMAILVASAVGASVVLYRAINSNTDVRSFTDLAGSNAPSLPHSLVVERTTSEVGGRTVPSATVSWSPPLYTGHPQLEGTPASLQYKVEYGCSELADITLSNIPDDTTNDPMDDSTTAEIDESKLDPDGLQTMYSDVPSFSIPDRVVEELFLVAMPPETVYCILQAQAYTCTNAQTQACANPGDNESRTGADDVLTGSEIYSLESEPIRFELSREPTEIRNPKAVVSYLTAPSASNRVEITWDAPEFTGVDETLVYEVRWQQRKPDEDVFNFGLDPVTGNPPTPPPASGPQPNRLCTSSASHTLVLPYNANAVTPQGKYLTVDIRITPFAATKAEAAQAVPSNSFQCAPSRFSSVNLDPDNSVELHSIRLTPAIPTTLNDQPSDTSPSPSEIHLRFEDIPTATDAAKRQALENSEVDVKVRWRVDADEEGNVNSYDLTWSRADGVGSAGLMKIEKPFQYLETTATPPNPAMTLEADIDLENDKAYNFILTKNLVGGEAVSTSFCGVISHRQRTPTPEVVVAPRSDTELIVRIAPPDQERFCGSRGITLSAPATQHYKVRVYDPASICASPGDYPNKQCSSDAYNECKVTAVVNRPAAEEVGVTGLTASTTYEVEVIAGHTCATNTIGFTIPSPNPMEYGYPSAPVIVQATTTASAVTPPAAPTGVSATFSASDATMNYDRWVLRWTEVSGATSYSFTIDHDTTMPAMPDTDARRYVYAPSNTPASFAARAPIAEFTCSKSGTTFTCTVRDDDPSSSTPQTNLKFEVWAIGEAGISASATQTSSEQ